MIQARLWLVIVAMAAAACGNGGDPDSDAGEKPRIVLPATRTEFSMGFTLDAAGAGTEAIGEVALSAGVGTVEFLGVRLPALSYVYIPWPEFNIQLYQTLVVATDRWYVVWLHCRSGELLRIGYAGTDGIVMSQEVARGTCIRLDEPVTRLVEFPAVDMAYPVLEQGYAFSGPELHYDGINPGTVILNGAEMVLLPFQGVDLVIGDEGWWELFALFYDPGRQRACFGIFYMYPQRPNYVSVAYTITLPTLSDPASFTLFDAAWEAP